MNHLDEVKLSYWAHLRRAWTIAGVLIIHGLFPEIWKHKASEMLCDHYNKIE
jgi:hypothetical protein